MFEYRVTRYDPARRDRRGAYTRDEWTSFNDIGRMFGGEVLTRAGYERVEDAYVSAALAFLGEAGVEALTVEGLEARGNPPVIEGSSMGLAEASEVIRRVLREEFWCRLEGPSAFVHLGWDYYMYIGVPRDAGRRSSCPGGRGSTWRRSHLPTDASMAARRSGGRRRRSDRSGPRGPGVSR